jgi:hypothetical protein
MPLIVKASFAFLTLILIVLFCLAPAIMLFICASLGVVAALTTIVMWFEGEL